MGFKLTVVHRNAYFTVPVKVNNACLLHQIKRQPPLQMLHSSVQTKVSECSVCNQRGFDFNKYPLMNDNTFSVQYSLFLALRYQNSVNLFSADILKSFMFVHLTTVAARQTRVPDSTLLHYRLARQ